MKTISISIDVEPDMYTEKYYGITQGIPKLIKILDKRKIKATFFITCDCLQKYPQIFQNLKKQGHEIALHSFTHKNFLTLNKKQKQKQIKKSISSFQKYLKQKPEGFRAPQHSIDNQTLDILEKNNFVYDSSFSPWNLYHMLFPNKIKINYKDNLTSKKIRKIRKNLYEVPIGTVGLPISALSLRALPYLLLKPFINSIKLTKNPVLMMHSWDLIEIPQSKLYKKCPLSCFLKRFEMFLDSFPKEKYKTIEKLIPPIQT